MERGDQLLASARHRTDAVRTAAARTGGAQRALGAALASLGGNTSRLAEAGQHAAWEVLASEARQEADAKPEADPRLAAMVRESEAAQAAQARRADGLSRVQLQLQLRIHAAAAEAPQQPIEQQVMMLNLGADGGRGLPVPSVQAEAAVLLRQASDELHAMEDEEGALLQLHVAVVALHEGEVRRCHGRLQRVGGLQSRMAALQPLPQPQPPQPTAAAPAAAPAAAEAGGEGASAGGGGGKGGKGGGGGEGGEGEEDLGGGLRVPATRARPPRGAAGPAAAAGSAEAEAQLGPGTRIGRLELRECIGQGSFAKVFRATPHALPAEPASPHGAVALKALDRARLTPKAVQMLAQEVRILP